VALQEELVEEFLGARAYLFAVPMYNYAMPSVFKAWLDQIMIPGRTIGLGLNAAPTADPPAVVASARGSRNFDRRAANRARLMHTSLSETEPRDVRLPHGN
jgi:FMN-dependent NADH-azoreductase